MDVFLCIGATGLLKILIYNFHWTYINYQIVM